MIDFKVLELLKSFHPEEIKDFEKFIASSYFNSRKDLVKYFKMLKEYYPEFEHKNLTKEKLIKRLIKGKENTKGEILLRTLNSELFRLGEKYITYKFIDTNEFNRNCFLFSTLSERSANTLAEKQSIKVNEILSRRTESLELYWDKILYSTIEGQLKLSMNKVLETSAPKLAAFENSLYFMFFLLQSAINTLYVHTEYKKIKEEKNVLSLFLKSFDIKKIIEFLEVENDKEHKILLTILYRILLVVEDEPYFYFDKLKNIFLYEGDTIDSDTKNTMMVSIINFCGTHKKLDLLKEKMEFIKISIQEGILCTITSQYMKQIYFKIIVKAAVLANEVEWLENNSEKILSFVEPKDREHSKLYLCIWINFYKKDFHSSLSSIADISKPDNYTYDIEIRELNIMNLTELSIIDGRNLESALYALNAYKKFVNEKNIENNQWIRLSKIFIYETSELLKYLNGKDNKFELEKIYNVRTRGWAKDKCAELLNIA